MEVKSVILANDCSHDNVFDKFSDVKPDVPVFNNFSNDVKFEQNSCYGLHDFQKLPPIPPSHFLTPNDYYNNFSKTASMHFPYQKPEPPSADDYQLPRIHHTGLQKSTTFDNIIWPPLKKQEPLDLRPLSDMIEVQNCHSLDLRPLGENITGIQNYHSLDLRPLGESVEFKNYHTSVIANRKRIEYVHHSQLSLSSHCSVPSISSSNMNIRTHNERSNNRNTGSSENVIDDTSLLALSTKDLNQQLKSVSQTEKQIYKKKRRTLKNRKYAEECRKRRNKQLEELKANMEFLQNEIQKIKYDYQQVCHERDYYMKLCTPN